MTYEMNMTDILNLTSIEGGDDPGMTVREYIETHPDRTAESDFYDRLTARIKQVGINLVPVHVGDRHSMTPYFGWRFPEDGDMRMFLGNGHHRVDICYRLGLEKMRVTDDIYDSGWEPDHMWDDPDFEDYDDEYDVI